MWVDLTQQISNVPGESNVASVLVPQLSFDLDKAFSLEVNKTM